ncbi:MAG: BlaI family transcriptional regulator [Clostridiales bacterium GWF2_36_10]|nr:MAG: BlaI family transcriptional regulator [Clostridiales bacterium GWF2_36_10]HAN21253.1 BlaI family transcriptional regulator [Clostridiales bacterium]
MENIKLFDSELKVMEIVWEKEPVSAKEINVITTKTIGWNKNTTYTIIKKLIEKNCIKRSEPNFICSSLVEKSVIQKAETENLIEKLYKGSKKAFFAAFLQNNSLSEKELAELKDMIENTTSLKK